MSYTRTILPDGSIVLVGEEPGLSADEIATLFGFANAAAMAAATEAGELTTPALTSGTSTAYTLTDTRIGTPVDGQVFALRVHTGCGASPTLAVNGGAAIGFARICADGINRALIAGQLQAATAVIVRYYAADVAYQVIAGLIPGAADIPSTLNATTFGGAIRMSGTHTAPTGSDAGVWMDSSGGLNFNGLYGQFFADSGLSGGWNNSVLYTTKAFQFFGVTGLINNDQSTRSLTICSGPNSSQANTASINLYGNSHATKPGDAEYYTGSAAGAAHSFFDKNGAEQLRVDENGLRANGIYTLSGGIFYLGYNNDLVRLDSKLSVAPTGSHVDPGAGRGYFHNGLQFGDASYMQAPLSTRAASTAIALCPVATGDTAKVEISETTIADCLAFVDAAGTVTLYDKLGGTVSASIVNSSSPSATEYGVYISAGVLYFKGGSSYVGKMASFSKIGKA